MSVWKSTHCPKAFNMTGWRIGFVCGNSKAVKAYGTVKDNTDSDIELSKGSIRR